MVTFIYTNSFDTTADLLVSKIGSDNVFRFNFNLWREYKIHITGRTFTIENPAGRRVTDADTVKFLWRKPMRTKHLFPDTDLPSEQNYLEEELWYAFRELVNFLSHEGKVVMITPFGDTDAGKFVQMHIARRYFKVPDWKFLSHFPELMTRNKVSVAKSLTSERVETGSVLYSTRVVEDSLDPDTPWMLQELVDAEKDITIAHVRGAVFCFELSRGAFIDRTVDWREVATETITNEWPVHVLPDGMEQQVCAFMDDMGLHYGRIDMLYGNGIYHFLEVNSNGEWGWLDADCQNGLFDKIISEIAPHTPVHGIPFPRTVRI